MSAIDDGSRNFCVEIFKSKRMACPKQLIFSISISAGMQSAKPNGRPKFLPLNLVNYGDTSDDA